MKKIINGKRRRRIKKNESQKTLQTNNSSSYYSYASSWVNGIFGVFGLSRRYVSLMDCLHGFCSTEDLTGEDQYLCEYCKSKNDGEKTFSVLRLPEILCIHIKRFRYDSYFSSSKISDQVTFPLNDLDMSPFIARRKNMNNNNDTYFYDLVAVINHRGGFGGGHYVAYAKNDKNGKWYEFDDRIVSQVTEDFVEGVEAYVLFYQKKN